MQTLWSRVAQAQSACRCRVCLHPTNALSRRATTAAPRRRVTGADLFTACYTTILGTAVVIDSQRKEVRRAELDAKLERARASLSTLAVQESPIAFEADETQGSWDHEGSTLPKTFSPEGGATKDGSVLLGELADIGTMTFAPQSRSTFPRHEVNWEQVEAAISAEEKSDNWIRLPANENQLEKTTKTVEQLVQTLLWQARSTSSAGQSADQTSTGDEFLDQAEDLLGEYPMYRNPHVEPEASRTARFDLSENFRTLFSKNPNVKEAVGKICFNLLASPAPPNLHNFMTLIAGFHRVQRPDLAGAVIDSYLMSTDWPATQQTVVCLLSHAIATNDVELFREIVLRMRGYIGDGMHIRRLFQRPSDEIANTKVDHWRLKDFVIRKFTYISRFDRRHEVFDTLTRGWLHFNQVQAASRSFIGALCSENLPSVDTIHELLKTSLESLNQTNARYLVKKLLSHTERVDYLMEYIIAQSTAQIARRIGELLYSLLSLADSGHIEALAEARLFLKQLLDSIGGRPGEFDLICKSAALVMKQQRLEEKTKRIEAHIKVLAIKHETGINLDYVDVLPPIEWNHRNLEKYPAVFHALDAIDLASGISTGIEIKRQLLRGMPDQTIARELDAAAGNLDDVTFQALISFYDPRQQTDSAQMETSTDVVGQLEGCAREIEGRIKAILFCYARKYHQWSCRRAHLDWHSMPVDLLFRYTGEHLQYQLKRRQTKRHLQEDAEQSIVAALQDEDSRTFDESSAPHRYVDMPASVSGAKSAATESNQRHVVLWTDGQVDPSRYAEATAW
ncbi:hypothetical protein PFICI_11350 [Pestalotiopsis fici W106-1]|uniref:Pentatricopeptide repeat domain-containing protein n=1 Tax=Pestalotiopsis fici (strain W106-1 / CGMCC3.15140) TaxID=1229662 RepID=W3WX73_PESFW|nr:uncharacterized protein PFICI_11350 [Pestalotiopsis fici W106-1]ETS77476.1 hypothetical protein PFICI_11350 [Pestalotiopsis fici W106-1]